MIKWSGRLYLDNFTLKQALQYADWNIITFQQVSYDAGRYQTYQPVFSSLIDIAKNECRKSKPVIAWQMPWAYGTGCQEEYFGKYGYNQQKMYKAITNATKVMMNQSEVDILVPVGTAIQNLRNTSLNNSPLDITRDYRHLDCGIGRYTASCTLFQALIASVYKVELSDTPFLDAYGDVPVTEKNFRICQQAAINACNTPFTVMPPTVKLRPYQRSYYLCYSTSKTNNIIPSLSKLSGKPGGRSGSGLPILKICILRKEKMLSPC